MAALESAVHTAAGSLHPTDSHKLFRVRAAACVLRLQKTSASREGSQRSAGRASVRPAIVRAAGQRAAVVYATTDPVHNSRCYMYARFSRLADRHKDVDEPDGWTVVPSRNVYLLAAANKGVVDDDVPTNGRSAYRATVRRRRCCDSGHHHPLPSPLLHQHIEPAVNLTRNECTLTRPVA